MGTAAPKHPRGCSVARRPQVSVSTVCTNLDCWAKSDQIPTLLSLKIDQDPGGYLEDLGPILEVLGFVVSTI